MGFSTTITIMNDGFDQLVEHPEDFVDAISRKMNDGGVAGIGNHMNMLEVMPARHASEFQLFAVHQNMTIALSPYDRETERLAREHTKLVRTQIEQARDLLDRLEKTLPDSDDN